MKNYEDMPFRGKISVNAWSLEHYGVSDWSRESSRRYWRRYHNHYNPHENWWKDDTIIGLAYSHLKWVVVPSRGHKRKTWKDFY